MSAALFAITCALVGPGCAETLSHAPPEAPAATPSNTVLFVHGMFASPACWDRWQSYFADRGYRTLAPAWPAHEGTAAAARAAHPDPELAAVDLPGVVDHYRKIIAGLDEKPILVGHSMGGLVVQILLSGRKSWRRYRKARAITEYREFADADHWIIAGPQWEEVATFTYEWLVDQGT